MAVKRPSTTPAMKLEVLRRHGAVVPCAICFMAVWIGDVEYDHHQALIDDGEHSEDNLRPTCRSCNGAKGVVEHKNNAKVKRIVKKREGTIKRRGPPMKSRGFDKGLSKKFSGEVVRK